MKYMNAEGYLTSAMDNVLASRLGRVARSAGSKERKDVGDSIDRGLILRRELEEEGFRLTYDDTLHKNGRRNFN